jgi:hypothetical protein
MTNVVSEPQRVELAVTVRRISDAAVVDEFVSVEKNTGKVRVRVEFIPHPLPPVKIPSLLGGGHG